ncbi:hypothetical protein [Fluviispira vulneris]|uniref:hypothetical protein n=1 Tax=Fluviispira vulneris TaxID=2763012 RepID=UPI00164475DD|nr:hypothetical protein [Fluviispira vulneris]
MRILLCLSTFILFSACTHLRIVGFNKDADTVTVQGGKWAAIDDYQKEANNYCGKEAKLLNMNETAEGLYAYIYNSGSGTANLQSIPIRRYQYTFKCN